MKYQPLDRAIAHAAATLWSLDMSGKVKEALKKNLDFTEFCNDVAFDAADEENRQQKPSYAKVSAVGIIEVMACNVRMRQAQNIEAVLEAADEMANRLGTHPCADAYRAAKENYDKQNKLEPDEERTTD